MGKEWIAVLPLVAGAVAVAPEIGDVLTPSPSPTVVVAGGDGNDILVPPGGTAAPDDDRL
ncbi:hypothetical protein [Micromonospora sp. CPCC 206061]|uniref:hypothetical protein n=1 Tax=Micromonospora sp. CPCC 206061 TaxID=3122410 RepID=UPI002FF320D3